MSFGPLQAIGSVPDAFSAQQGLAAAGGGASTNSAAFVDIGDNGVTQGWADWVVNITTTRQLLLDTRIHWQSVTIGAGGAWQILLDGVAVAGQPNNEHIVDVASTAMIARFITPIPAQAPGNHTFRVQWKTTTASTIQAGVNRMRIFTLWAI